LNPSPQDNYKAELEGIKAPLGVLLYLIKRDNIDIYDIPIAKITKDYLGYLDLMEELQIDLAGEFFVMAATLMRIKVQMLLRRDDEIEDPREELVRNLVEYRKMVEAAQSMKAMEERRYNVFTRPVPQNEKELRAEPELELNLFEIMRAFRDIMAQFETQRVSEVQPEEYTIEDKIEVVVARLVAEPQIMFRDFFTGASSRIEVVVTFMAILELMKRAAVRCVQDAAFGEIWIYRRDDPPAVEEAAAEEPAAEVRGEPSTDAAAIESGGTAGGAGDGRDGATNG
jgi:segregation and condensation protein A